MRVIRLDKSPPVYQLGPTLLGDRWPQVARVLLGTGEALEDGALRAAALAYRAELEAAGRGRFDLVPRTFAAVTISGDCLLPVASDGEIFAVDPDTAPEPGELAAFGITGAPMGLCKFWLRKESGVHVFAAIFPGVQVFRVHERDLSFFGRVRRSIKNHALPPRLDLQITDAQDDYSFLE